MANSINGVVRGIKTVSENRRRFLEKSGVDINKTVCMWVTHGDEIIEADPKTSGVSMLDDHKAVRVDGLMTDKKGLYLFLLIADCLPIIIYDPVREAVGLIHAGWKGLDKNIAGKAVEKFKSKYKSKSKNLIVGIGPSVREGSFVKNNPSQKNDPGWKPFLNDLGDEQYGVNLIGFARRQLMDTGILGNNIFESGTDTASDERFFSYVRERNLPVSQQGRFACVVGLI